MKSKDVLENNQQGKSAEFSSTEALKSSGERILMKLSRLTGKAA
jgi:hypothetical protein